MNLKPLLNRTHLKPVKQDSLALLFFPAWGRFPMPAPTWSICSVPRLGL